MTEGWRGASMRQGGGPDRRRAAARPQARRPRAGGAGARRNAMPREKEGKPGFEEALKRLEEIVAAMEGGDLPLDQALERYEEGVRLSRLCAATLDDAEKRIEMLAKGGDGKTETRPFTPAAGGDDAGAAAQRPAGKRARDEGMFLL